MRQQPLAVLKTVTNALTLQWSPPTHQHKEHLSPGGLDHTLETWSVEPASSLDVDALDLEDQSGAADDEDHVLRREFVMIASISSTTQCLPSQSVMTS